MKKGHIKIANIADTHTFWVADVLVISIDTTTNRVDLGRPPHIILSAVFNTPFRLSLASDVSK